MKIVKKKKKCDLCMKRFHGKKNDTGMPISERISHLIDCYQTMRNKTPLQLECISNQIMPVDIPVKTKIYDGNSENMIVSSVAKRNYLMKY